MTSLLFLSACSIELDKLANTEDKASPHTLTREWKTVVRYDCDGNVISKKMETTKSPTKFISISPKTFQNIHSSTFKNLTNGSANPSVIDFHKFTIDMAPTLLNMKVQDGINQISYEFSYCDQPELGQSGVPTGNCLHTPVIRESGSLFINITYKQFWLDGEIHSKPTQDQCL